MSVGNDIDIVDELRAAAVGWRTPIFHQAADEIERLRGEAGWEYSIAYPRIGPEGIHFWEDDGQDVMDRETAEKELRENRDSYLEDDRLVRRRPASDWEPIPEGENDD